ncbi:MAG TPA: type II toxin-antitoxin system VapC family toxin [Acidobacteriota bacterium]|jgi:predicted nucleic acid-binding protein|nr:type II toxin-antitoxin system VapC family toxin [Acidobacteriota bacterium]
MIVVDTNVIAYLWLPGPHSDNAERALRKDSVWAAPVLWRSEFRNVIVGYMRRRQISYAVATDILSEAEALMRGREYSVPSDHILRWTMQSNCSAYDCEFVALAQDLETSLVTTDKQLIAAFPKIAVTLDKFVRNVSR